MYNHIHIYNDKKKWNQKDVKECDKQKSQISSKLHMIYIKVKVKAVCGSYRTAALRHIVLLPK